MRSIEIFKLNSILLYLITFIPIEEISVPIPNTVIKLYRVSASTSVIKPRETLKCDLLSFFFQNSSQ